jgi:hypothetical protein
MNIIDKNFTVQYTVTVKFETKNKKMYNHYKNLNWEFVDDEKSGLFIFDKKSKDLQQALNIFFIVLQNNIDVETIIVVEYFYNQKYIGCEYIENFDVAMRYIADEKFKKMYDSSQHELNTLNEVIKNELGEILSATEEQKQNIKKYLEGVHK